MKNGLVADVLSCTNPVVLNKNSEMVSIAKLSDAVTFAGMNVCERNDAFGGVGSTNCIAGKVTSLTVKLVVSVLLMLPLISFAIIVTLYTPGGSVRLGTKVTLKMSEMLVITNTKLVLFGKVILARTVSNWRLSVTFAVILTACVWLRRLGSAVTFLTSGKTASVTAVKVVVSVSLILLLVSFAKKLTLY